MPEAVLVRNVIVAAVVTTGAYFVFLGHRNDLLGHHLAGFGATLLLLCVLAAVRRAQLTWDAVALTIAAIGIGFVTESSIFRFAFFDPVDFTNQSLGACIACACVIETRPNRSVIRRLAVAGSVLLVGGFVFAFT